MTAPVPIAPDLPGEQVESLTIERAIDEGEAAFAARQPESGCPFAHDGLRAAWLTGWKLACAVSEHGALQREVWAMQDTLRKMTARLDQLEYPR